MRVLLATDWHPSTIGGVQSHVRSLALKLQKLSVEVAVVSKPCECAQAYCSDHFSRNLTHVPVVLPIGMPLSPPAYDELKSVVREFNPDVVHAHHAFTPLSLMSLAVAEELRIARVLTNHSITIGYNVSKLWRSVASTLLLPYKLYISKAQLIISVSRAADSFVSNFAENSWRTIIPNGVDTDFYSPKNGVPESSRILFVGRLVLRKGAHVLLRAFKKVSREDRDVVLSIVGSGYMLPILLALAEKLDLKGRVLFHGQVDDVVKRDLYGDSTLVALPSLYGESFCVTALEAMSTGKPVVASSCGGLKEIISDGRDGLLTEPGDHEELADCIISLLSDDNLRRRLSESARRKVLEHYSWDNIALKILKAYEEVCAELEENVKETPSLRTSPSSVACQLRT